MPEPLKLVLNYGTKEPVSLRGLTQSLNAFAAEYRSVQKRTATTFEQDKAELYITRISEGSIIAQLTPLVPVGMALVEKANTIIEFSQHLRSVVGFLLGRKQERVELTKPAVKNVMSLVEPIARENKSALIIQGNVNIGDNSTLNITISNPEARIIRQRGKEIIQKLDAPSTHDFPKVKLLWYQARNENASTAGDRAIIPDLWERPVKVIFSSDMIKAKMIGEEGNPFRTEYLVDVIADFKGKKPTSYLISKVHDSRKQKK